MDSFIIYWIKVNCHLFVLMLKVSQICLARAIQASLSFYTSSWILERFLILWHKMSQTHLDFLCLLVFACRQWGLCWDCLGLCSPGLILVMRSPHRNSPFTVSVVAGPALVVLRIVRHISATTIRELWNAKVYHSHAPEDTRHPWGDTARSWVERESSWPSLDLGFCLFGVEDGVSMILKFHSLLMNLKNKSGN